MYRLASLIIVFAAVASCSAQPDQARPAATERSTAPAASSSAQVAAGRPTPRPASDSACRVTVPMDASAVPPVVTRAGGGWHGQDDLWVSVLAGPPDPATFARVDGFYRLKYGSVTLDNGKLTSRFGPPAVQATRLDGPGTAAVELGGYGTTSTLQFWPTVINFPDPGCWRVTSTFRRTVVRFVVKVL